MRRGRVALTACLLPAAIAAGAGGASASSPIKPGLLPPPPTVPAELRDLEAKTVALQITSLELKLTTSINLARHTPKGLAGLLDFGVEGVETTTPPAAAIKMTLFGHPLRLRIVGSKHFLFSWPLARRDGGRPWVELGHGSLGKLLGGAVSPSEGGPASESFTGLLAMLNEGRNLRALGPSTVDGWTVMGFQAEPSSSSLTSGGGELAEFASRKHRPKGKPTETVVLSMYFASNGLPVRTSFVARAGRTSVRIVAEFPAINFPDTIPAPPADHVITEAGLRKLFPKPARRRVVGGAKARPKSKQ